VGKRYLILFLVCAFAAFTDSCDNPGSSAQEIEAHNLMPTDSFHIGKLYSSQNELTSLHPLNDSILIGFDHFDQINFYSKQGNTFAYVKSKTLLPQRSFAAFLSLNESQVYLFAEKTIYTYDRLFNLKDSFELRHRMRYLKENYFPACDDFLPLITFGDTLVSYYAHSNVADFFTTYKEPAFMEFTLAKKIDSAKTYLPKPSQLKYYEVDFFSFQMAINNSLFKLYNGLDTIYQYNRTTHKEAKIPIHNKDYRLPTKSTSTKLNDFGRRTKRMLSSFSYKGMFYNQSTGNTILFYYTPLNLNADKNPGPDDRILKAAVLDRQFRIINYCEFKKGFSPPITFFYFPNKGLAMPIENEDATSEKTLFYIYNF
jgi:hypothetical protein